MRFTVASVALLALAHSLAPGVHGAPAVVSDHANSLAVRQDPGALITLLAGLLQTLLGSVTATATSIPPQLAEQVEQIAQMLQESAASVVPRAASSDSTSFTTLSSTTTSHVLPVATDQIGTSTVSSVSGVSFNTPQASSTPPTRMRRQLLPLALPTVVPSDVVSIVGSNGVPLPVQSVAASALSAVLSKVGVTSQSTASKPTSSNPGASTSQV